MDIYTLHTVYTTNMTYIKCVHKKQSAPSMFKTQEDFQMKVKKCVFYTRFLQKGIQI